MSKNMLGELVRLITTVPAEWLGTLVDLVEKLIAGVIPISELKKFVRKEPCWKYPWEERDGVIYFSVTSDGTTGPKWIDRLLKARVRLGVCAKNALCSADFQPTKERVTYRIAVLKGELFSDNDRITKNIRAEAMKRKFSKPNVEVACLIREKFSDNELAKMGLGSIITMHEPIKDSGGDPSLLGSYRYDWGSWLYTYWDDPDRQWGSGYGFAFVAQQA